MDGYRIRQPSQVVPAFQKRYYPPTANFRRQLVDTAGKLPKATGSDIHVHQGIILMGVKTGRYEYQLRPEIQQRFGYRTFQNAQVLAVSVSSVKGKVKGKSTSPPHHLFPQGTV